MSEISHENSKDHNSPRQLQIDEIAEKFLSSLRQSASFTSVQDLVAQHPDLAPDLERRLKFVQSVFQALQPDPNSGGSVQDPTGPPPSQSEKPDWAENRKPIERDHVVSIRCPHCGNLLKIVTHGKTEVTCGSCGSAVSVDPEGTRTDSQVRTPKFIAHFKIISVLGQGAFGTAYKAEDTRLNRHVAVKIPRAGSFATTNDEMRFVREARHAAQLRHPNIVQVHEIANDRGIPYLVSDFIDGITLSDLISGRRLTFRESAEMMITIADAVQFAHENHVIHRDLKPSNILLDAQNKPHVADFGLARQTEGEFTVTLEGEVLGTPAYMSPEQAAGKEVDIRTDVYSLGVMLYRLVVGELPFRGSQRMMIHQVLHDDPKAPRKLDERVPRDLNTIILKAMAKEREKRYQTSGDFSQDLRNWLRSQPIVARPVGIYGKTIRWCRRNPTGAFSVAGASVLLLAIAGLSIAWGYREQTMRGVEAQLKDKALGNERESNQRLFRLHNQNGMERVQAGDQFGALPWFVEALDTATKLAAASPDSAEVQMQRLRLGMFAQSLPKLRQLWPLAGKIQALKFSADGKILLATAANGAIQVLDPERSEVITLQSPDNPEIWNSDLDPSGSRACTATLENKASLWDVQDHKFIASLSHDDRVIAVSFSSDGKWIATSGSDSKAGLWDAVDGKLVSKFTHPGKIVARVKFSPDSQSLLTISRIDPDHPCELRLWDIAKGELRVPLMTYSAFVHDVIFDKAGERIFAACEDGGVVIWNAKTGELFGEPLKQFESLHRVLLVDDETSLVTCSYDGKVSFWDLKSGSRKENSIQSQSTINDIAVDPSADFVALANGDKRTRVYWKYCGSQLGASIPHGGRTSAVAFHPDGRRLAVGGEDGVVRLWDLAGFAPRNAVIRTQDQITKIVYSKDGRRILVGSRDDTARQWDSKTFAAIGNVMQHADDVVYCEYDEQERYIVTAGADNKAQVWDATSGKSVGPPLPHTSAVLRAKFIPGTDRVITTTIDGQGAIWTIGSDQPLYIFHQDSRLVNLEMHPDGKKFALSGEGPFLQIRSTEDGSPIGKPIEHKGLVKEADFGPSGQKIVSASFGGSIAVSELDGKSYPSVRWDLGSSIFAARFVRSDDAVITGDDEGKLTLWKQRGPSYEAVWSSVEAAADLTRVATHPKMNIVFAATNFAGDAFQPNAGEIRLHDLATGALLSRNSPHFRPISQLEIRTDGRQFATGSSDGTVRIWDFVSDDRSIGDLRKLAYFYNGYSCNGEFQQQPLDGTTQSSEFQSLRKAFPDSFECSADEIQRWSEEVKWVIESQQKWLNSPR